jgi:hypothetical protein
MSTHTKWESHKWERAKNDPTTNKRATKSKAHDEDDVLSDSSYDSNLDASSDDDSDPEFDPDCENVDEDDVNDVPVFSYDQDASFPLPQHP